MVRSSIGTSNLCCGSNSGMLALTITIVILCSWSEHLTTVSAFEPETVVARNPTELKCWVKLEVGFWEKLRSIDPWLLANKPFTPLLNRYSDAVNETLRNLDSYYSGGLKAKTRAIARNPIATYKSFRRIIYFLQDLRTEMQEYHEELFTQFPMNWLTPDAVDDVMLAILRIQNNYVLLPAQFSEGEISGVQTGETLDALHCYELGLFASIKGLFAIGILWLETALSKSVHDQSMDKGLILSALRFALSKHDDLFEDRGIYDASFFNQKLKSIQALPDFKEIRKMRRLELLEDLIVEGNDTAKAVFWEICRNGSLEGFRSRLDKLSCWYDSSPHPYWTIAPLKVEKIAEDPDVFQVYDILQDKGIELMKETVENELRAAVVEDADAGPDTYVVSNARTSVNTWIWDEETHPELVKISRVLEIVTGLRVGGGRNTAEEMQIGAYTFGGHYGEHMDPLRNENEECFSKKGGRIATLMFYLSTPELGGNTAFIRAGTSARAIKGSVVIWHNLWPNSKVDHSTVHGACPVILGEKWVANKWVRMNAQFSARPCPLVQEERFRFQFERRF